MSLFPSEFHRKCYPELNQADYYEKRGTAGLIIAESAMVHKDASGYRNAPGIFHDNHVEGWREEANKVVYFLAQDLPVLGRSKRKIEPRRGDIFSDGCNTHK